MKNTIPIILLIFVCTSCTKFLDEKPDKRLIIPETLSNIQSMLDNYLIINQEDPSIDEFSSDNYYLLATAYQATLIETERRAYVWGEDIFEPDGNDWSKIYSKVYSANTVLETIEKIERTSLNSVEWDNIKGQALLIRAKAFLQGIQIWSPAYDPISADKDMGIPLRLNTDFNDPAIRASVQESYNQVIKDFTASIPLLPVVPVHPSRASKPAAYGLLARTYLAMRNYPKCGLYADSSLKLNNALLNYNTLNPSATLPIPPFNPEVMVWNTAFKTPLANAIAKIDTILYRSYAANDCRKTIFYSINTDGTIAFKGSYISSSSALFTGIATDEVYLMRAEAFARGGNSVAALSDLNSLLQQRMKTGTFVPVTASDANDALTKIIAERRKELPFRGLRWMDIKRLNKEGAAITLKRIINNQTSVLPPNDPRYALPIPEFVIAISGMTQNPR